MLGNMMPFQLTINALMQHGKRQFSDTEIVSITSDYPIHRCTLGDVFDRAAQLANFLKAEGINKGDRVGTLAWNDFRHMELYYGVSCSGAVCHTINPRLHPEQIEFIVNDAEDQLLFIDPLFVPAIQALRDTFKSVKRIVVLTSDASVIDGLGDDWAIYESVIDGQDTAYDWPELNENDASSLCYTSGTTGNPKGVLYSHRSLVLHTMAEVAPDALGVGRRDVILPVVPMFHVNSWGIPYLPAMTGCKLVFAGPKSSDGAVLEQLLREEAVTLAAGVPTIWKLLHDYLKQNNIKLTHLKKLLVGGSAMPPNLFRFFEEEQGATILHAWGMTEMSPLGTINHALPPALDNLTETEKFDARLRQGYPIFGVELKITDADDKELAWDGESSGSLQTRGLWIMDHYFKKPETRSASGWFDTGDIACMTADGSMKITDRKKDVIKSGGEWISSIDIENAMMSHPDVSMAAVIGAPHPKWDERPLLVLEENGNTHLTKEQVTEWLTDKIAKWWLPDDVKYVEKLPLTGTGKIHKLVLREQFKDFSF